MRNMFRKAEVKVKVKVKDTVVYVESYRGDIIKTSIRRNFMRDVSSTILAEYSTYLIYKKVSALGGVCAYGLYYRHNGQLYDKEFPFVCYSSVGKVTLSNAKYVAYYEDGSIIHPTELVYLSRKFKETYVEKINTLYNIVVGRKRYRRFKHYFKAVRTFQELKAAKGVVRDEGEPDFRGRRKNLPTSWDDLYRVRESSWKRSFKCRKQWQKHL